MWFSRKNIGGGSVFGIVPSVGIYIELNALSGTRNYRF